LHGGFSRLHRPCKQQQQQQQQQKENCETNESNLFYFLFFYYYSRSSQNAIPKRQIQKMQMKKLLIFYFIFLKNIIVDSPLRAFTAVAHTHLAVLALPFLLAPTCLTRLCVESRP
jgi:hypothetical protein